jgi:hypothetical protein
MALRLARRASRVSVEELLQGWEQRFCAGGLGRQVDLAVHVDLILPADWADSLIDMRKTSKQIGHDGEAQLEQRVAARIDGHSVFKPQKLPITR